MKLAYIGIDLLFPALEAIEGLNCEILEIFSCKTDNVTEFNLQVVDFAQRRNIPCQLEALTTEDLRRLENLGCELILCGGYYHLIPTDTTIPMVNLHPSLLPQGRGAWPMPHVILNGDTTAGFTLHKISGAFDGGDIVLQRSCPVDPLENLQTLTEKLQRLAVQLVEDFVPRWQKCLQQATPQGVGEYQPYLQETDFPLTPQTTVDEADRILRGFYGYACIYQGVEGSCEILRGAAQKGARTGQKFPLADGYISLEMKKELG